MPRGGVPLPNLRAWRVHGLLSQHQLAGKADVGPATIARLETGGRANYLTVQRLANALNITPRQLMRESPEEPDKHS
jgi:transcriptional regulator with XRE-family HTH domain